MTAKALVLRAAGTNCDVETAYAFELAGIKADTLHVNRLREKPAILADYRFLAIAGGFSYGDDVASGRIFANELTSYLGDALKTFVDKGGYAIGICNGFQVLVKAGLLPRLDGAVQQQATLMHNPSGLYTDRWVRLEIASQKCAWIDSQDQLELPVAHAEGRFEAPESVLNALEKAGQVAFRYHAEDNFNGSARRIAGICDPTGRVVGLMPHPERFLRFENHPCWTRLPRQEHGDGFRLFRAAARHAKES
jgi:phosphoribosylformylglycinamidine synthase